MKIGDLILRKEPLLLAPMEDVTNHMFRGMCKESGVDLMFTEFVSSEALIRQVEKTKGKLFISNEERPIGVQLYGKDPDALAEAAKIAEEAQPELIDLNFGCPVKKIASKGSGAGLLKDIPLMLEITKAVVEAVKLPVTVKTRLGWDHDSMNVVEIAERLQDVGIQALTVHGRTRSQLYTGNADWTLIGELKNNPRIKIPIIGNGDINSPGMAREYFNRYGVDAIMIGRASIGRPHIFKEIRYYLDNNEFLPPLSMDEHVEMMQNLLLRSVSYFGERRGILHTRRHLAVSFKGLPNFRETKIKLLRSLDVSEMIDIMNNIKTLYHGFTVAHAHYNNGEQ